MEFVLYFAVTSDHFHELSKVIRGCENKRAFEYFSSTNVLIKGVERGGNLLDPD